VTQKIAKKIKPELKKDPTNNDLIAAARNKWQKEGVEIDEGAKVSRGGEAGAYVRAWVWVDFADVPGYED